MKKTVALLLCLIMVFSFPASALAAEITSSQPVGSVNEKTEVVSMRDTYSKTYLLPDGSYQYVAYAEPIHYKDNSDAFVEINNAITENGTRDGYKYTNTSNSWNAFFAEKLNSDDAVLITDGDHAVSFTFPGQTGLGTATKSSTFSKLSSSKYYEKIASDNRTVVYQNVVANVDIVYTVQHSVLKEDIVLKSKAAPNTFKFRLNTNGLTVDEKDGIIALFDSEGNEIFAFTPLYMEDSNGKRSENVQLTCESIKNGYEITISADAAFLNAADTVYPVVIDPSIMVTGYDVTFDTCVDQEYPTSNYYLSENLWTGGALGTNAMRTYMKYTLPTGISASQVTSAYVYLLKKEHQAPTIRAYRVTSDWSSSAITWNSKPAYTTTYASGVATNTTGNWYGLNVTTLVKYWLNGTYPNYGMVLKEPSESDSAQKTKFYSSDAPSPNKPELVINYTYYGSRPYQDTSRKDINCMGYALEYAEYITGAMLNIVRSEINGMTVAQLQDYVKGKAESWMNTNIGSSNWGSIDSYNSAINTNWFRIILRVGFIDLDGDNRLDASEQYDYHWWYQTSTGNWADKLASLPSEYRTGTANVNPANVAWINGSLRYSSSGVFYQIKDIRGVLW